MNLGKAVKELALKCGFENPLKCTNDGAEAPGFTILQNAHVAIPTEQRLARSNHLKEVSGRPYSQFTDAGEKKLQDGLVSKPAPRIKNPYKQSAVATTNNIKNSFLLPANPYLHHFNVVPSISTPPPPVTPPHPSNMHPRFNLDPSNTDSIMKSDTLSPTMASTSCLNPEVEHLKKEIIRLKTDLSDLTNEQITIL